MLLDLLWVFLALETVVMLLLYYFHEQRLAHL